MLKTGTLTIDVPDCPVPEPWLGVPSWVIGWGIPVTLVVIVGLFILIYVLADVAKERANERRTAEISMAKLHTKCDTCGESYRPEVSG